MKRLIIACSLKGYELANQMKSKMQREDPGLEIILRLKCSRGQPCSVSPEELLKEESLSDYISGMFPLVDAIIFVAAAGIAIRSVAPCLVHKSVDPAVLAVDETGKFCISLLSGHFGGANELARKVAGMIGAQPVITTATDCENRFSVDLFAKTNGLVIAQWDRAKEISAAVLAEKKIGFISRLPWEGPMPEEVVCIQEGTGERPGKKAGKMPELGFLISPREEKPPFAATLQLIPRCIHVGIGCRKHSPMEEIEEAVLRCFGQQGLLPEALKDVVSIDLKRDEEGICQFCEKYGVPFQVYSAQRLKEVRGSRTSSDFVRAITGVDNVCERSALLKGGRLISSKQVYRGVTVALTLQEETVRF